MADGAGLADHSAAFYINEYIVISDIVCHFQRFGNDQPVGKLGKYSSNGFLLIVIAPLPERMYTRATEVFLLPVPVERFFTTKPSPFLQL